MEKTKNLEMEMSLEELDILEAVLEGLQSSMDPKDEDKALVDSMVEKLVDYMDKLQNQCEYLTGNDFPADLVLHLSTTEDDIKKTAV